ncbi:MAG: hypothetical protein KIT43_09330 [Bauldia sp.]|nr:hypothetical protein [Bauldia sp.]MCW5717575.1 hypothetical protein [Bauldia sp.]
MAFKTIGAVAALCFLGGCVTAGVDQATRVDTWEGLDVREMIPPLQIMAAANLAQDRGRLVGGNFRDGAFTVLPNDQLAAACVDRIGAEEGPLLGCTVRSGAPSQWTYAVYVSESYPRWYRQLVATHEFGHVGQSELGMPIGDAGFTSPTVDLIRRLGG